MIKSVSKCDPVGLTLSFEVASHYTQTEVWLFQAFLRGDVVFFAVVADAELSNSVVLRVRVDAPLIETALSPNG